MTTPTGGNLGDATVTVNANTDPALRALNQFSRDAQGRLRDVRGRFVNEGRLINGTLTQVTNSTNRFGDAVGGLRSAALLLSPALIPIAAQAAPIAAGLGAAAVAVGVFAAAAAGQASAISEAAEAEKKYKDTVAEHGATSQKAAEAQAAYARQIQQMPAATRTTAAALSSLKDQYQGWSDALASDTMPVATKGLQLFSSVFPKLTPLVQGTSLQLERFVTIAAGGVASPGFDRFMKSFSTFAVGSLEKANDALIRFTRTLNTGKVSGGVSEFMEYARANAPLVRDTLAKVAEALGNILVAASNVGPGLLTVVNAFAGLVAALPPGVITAMLQLALALKAVRLAAAGAAAMGAGVTAFGAAITAMRTAAAGATGVLPRLAAAIGAMSRSVKLAVAGTGIGLLLIALSELSQWGRTTAPDVDKLTSSLARLGQSGKVTGEAAKSFGKDLAGLHDKVSALTDPSNAEKVQQWVVSLGGLASWDSTPVKEAKEQLNSVDEALAGLVKNGQADLAAAALKRLTAEYGKGGRDTKQFTSELDDYKAALADAKFEQQLAAQAMGLFGQQAQATSAKLAEQKASADGLRQAIQALNDVNRAGLGGMIGFEAAVDAAAKAARDNAGALTMSGGQLNLNSEKARNAATALNDLATKTDEAAGAAREQGASWATVNGIYQRGRDELIKQAAAMGLTKEQARQLADQILKVPSSKSVKLEMRTQDAITGLNSVIAAIKKTPNAKSVTVKALTSDAVALLRDLGFKVKQMKDGRFKVIAETKAARDSIGVVQRARDALKSKTITLSARDRASAIARDVQRAIDKVRGKSVTLTTVRHTINVEATAARNAKNYGATGGLYTGPGSGFKHRGKRYARGGLVDGPGTETSDSVMAPWLSRNEFVVNAKQTAAHLPLLKAINSGQLGLAGGGLAGAGTAAGQGLASGMESAARMVKEAARAMAAAVVAGVREELQIASPSKKTKALAKDVGAGFIKGLTGSQAKIKSVSADLAKDIWAAFTGRKDNQLVAMVNRQTSKLLSLAKQRDSIAKRIADANKFATDTASRARATGGLASIVQPDAFSPKFVKGQMQASLNQIKAFTANVQKLQKKGLNKDLLRQILEMGPEQGGAFAKALAGADSATIKQYNSLNSQINKESGKLGKVGADLLYDSGKKAGQGFLTGLKAQQKQIEKLMLDIAKGMQKAIKKALGIKSPSRVMEAVGRMTVLGLHGGITRSVPAVRSAMLRVAGAVASGAPSPLPAMTAAASVGTLRTVGSATVRDVAPNVTVIVQNNGVLGSQRQVEDWLTKSLDNLSRTNRLPRGLRSAS